MSESNGFLRRWSRLKRGEASASGVAAAHPIATEHAAATGPSDAPVARDGPAAGEPLPAQAVPAGAAPAEAALPPVESLDLEADFTAFMREEVSEGLRRAALRKLFSDPHFNRMDGLDIYIDDYTVADPIPEDILKRMTQFETLFAEPRADDAESPSGEAPSMTETAATTPAQEPQAGAEGPAENADNLSGGGQFVDGDVVQDVKSREIRDSSGV